MKKDKNKNMRHTFRLTVTSLCLCLAMVIVIGTAGIIHAAERYPTKRVELIVPFKAGAATDMIARFMSEELSNKFNQKVDVVNKPGGGTIVGTQFVMDAPPDGHTILVPIKA